MNEMSRSKAKPTTGFAGTVHISMVHFFEPLA